MDAIKYLDSRLGRTIEQMKVAYLSGKHIIFLVTDEPAFVRELIEYASILPLRMTVKKEGFKNQNEKTNTLYVNSSEFIKTDNLRIEEPQLYIYSLLDKIEQKLPLTSLVNYVNYYEGLSNINIILPENDKEKIAALKKSMIWIIADTLPDIPSVIEPYSEIITVPFMVENEFKEFVSKLANELDGTALNEKGAYKLIDDNYYLRQLYDKMRGLNVAQISSILRKNKEILGSIYFDSTKAKTQLDRLLKNIREESERMISSSAALTLIEPKSAAPKGWDNVEEWFEKNTDILKDPQNEEYLYRQMKTPGGILVSGIPGSGKSMMAEYIAYELKLPLIRMDLGDVLGKHVGDSEKNMKKALSLIEALSPCVLWIDEMEKAFAGSSGDSHETTKRALGKFLTWMQEKDNKGISCFVFATANDISSMPPEMFRSGRFAAKFYTFMPSAEECASIFESHIEYQCKKYNRQAKSENAKPLFDRKEINKELLLELLNDEKKGQCIKETLELETKSIPRKNKFFTGSDIKELIENAKVLYLHKKDVKNESRACFDSKVFKECLIQAIEEMKTYGETNLEDIALCYSSLVTNNFTPVSTSKLLPFEGYNKSAIYTRDTNTSLYSYPEEEDHCKNLSLYDKQLYLAIRNTINSISGVIANREMSKR